jgi:hypothetical protein
MAKRPDLDALTVPKGGETITAAPKTEGAGKAYAHTLSFRLTADQYRRLRRFVADQEEKHGRRTTHQAIIETALDEYMGKTGA